MPCLHQVHSLKKGGFGFAHAMMQASPPPYDHKWCKRDSSRGLADVFGRSRGRKQARAKRQGQR
jgi:hypothetical protein